MAARAIARTPKPATIPHLPAIPRRMVTRAQWERRIIWRKTIVFTTVVLLILNVQRFLTSPDALAAIACPTANTAVTVPLRATTTPINLQLSTNIADGTQLDPTTNSHATSFLNYLNQWNPPLVRLHFGFRGDVFSLPEAQPGVWNFQVPDTAIAQLRAQGTTFVLNIRSAPPFMFDSTGQLRDRSFGEFALYVARLVRWYNKGGFTDDSGHFLASGHYDWVHTWEIWNEPSSGDEIPAPVPNRNATWLSPQDYARLFDVVVQAMRSVDPTVVVGGPAITWEEAWRYAPYLSGFLQNVTQPVGFISVHFYPTGNLHEPDQAILARIANKYDAILSSVQPLLQHPPHGPPLPLWVDELGFNESSRLPIDPRGTSAISYAYIAQIFIESVRYHVAQVDQFPFASNPQYGEIDEQTGQPFRTYWLYRMLSQAFPPGSQLLSVHALSSGVTALAALSPDRHKLYVLLDNQLAAHPQDVNGKGAMQTICIDLVNTHTGIGLPIGAPATAWTFDASTPASDPPSSATQWLINAGQDHLIFEEHLAGYSATLVELPVN